VRIIPFVHEGLGNSSYIVDLGNAKAVVIDPDRTVQRYVAVLNTNGLEVSGIFETHLHADFVSGGRELASRTGAAIFIAEEAAAKFAHQAVRGGQTLQLNGFEAAAIASPGHTPEHLSYVFKAAAGPPVLFSGGSLIVGGAARTDLISAVMTESLTRSQFRTVRQAFSSLPDETVLLPTHGGGSFCSTGSGQERTSTLGQERRGNPILFMEHEDEFAGWFPTTFPAVPDYFYRLRAVNQAGPRLREEIAGPKALDAGQFASLLDKSVVIDGRSKEEYAEGHVPGSLSNPYRDSYAVWLGWLVPEKANLLFVADESQIDAIVDQSLLVGYERFSGWLKGGMQAWESSARECRRTELMDAPRALRYLREGALALDVREPDEYRSGHLPDALHIPLGSLAKNVDRIPSSRPIVVYCGHGERASTAVSLLERAGMRDLVNLDGGAEAWEGAGYPFVSR
jgi:hydroxyacylglutathione hydrolase